MAVDFPGEGPAENVVIPDVMVANGRHMIYEKHNKLPYGVPTSRFISFVVLTK